jgi:hypothetical protein
MERNDKQDPMCVASRMDNEDPQRDCEKHEIALPNRTNCRTEKLDPTFVKSRIENAACNLANCPATETVDPKRTNERMEQDEPRFPKFKTDTEEPNLT